nr:hypothetical protein [Tanacetum cinerariifolium]
MRVTLDKAAKGVQRKGKGKMVYAPKHKPSYAPKSKNPPPPKKDNPAKTRSATNADGIYESDLSSSNINDGSMYAVSNDVPSDRIFCLRISIHIWSDWSHWWSVRFVSSWSVWHALYALLEVFAPAAAPPPVVDHDVAAVDHDVAAVFSDSYGLVW